MNHSLHIPLPTPLTEEERRMWHELESRFYDAATTEDEEELLFRFAASRSDAEVEWRELRAVMGVVAVGRRRLACGVEPSVLASALVPMGRSRRLLWSWMTAAGVAAAVFVGAVLTLHGSRQHGSYAYIDGQRITDPERVMEAMLDSWEAVGYQETSTVEAQLGEMFDALPAD